MTGEKAKRKTKLIVMTDRRKRLLRGGGAAAIEKQHARRKLTAWERLELLFDRDTFRELNLWVTPLKTGFDIDDKEIPRDALVAGYGKVNGRIVYAFAYDFTVSGGSQDAMQIFKVGKLIEEAIAYGHPFVGIIDSAGRRIQDFLGRWGYRPPVRISDCEESAFDMYFPPMASGVVPHISLMLGPGYAGTAYSPMMSDFLFFNKETSFMSLASPALLKSATFVDVTQEEIGGAMLHATTTGSCDVLVDSDEEALDKCRRLLGFLPSNWKENPPIMDTGDDPYRTEEKLLELSSDISTQAYDVHEIIALLTDNTYFFELQSLYAQNLVTGFAHLSGQSVGIIANNPRIDSGSLNQNACDKAAHFIRTCDSYNIPLVFIVDTPGFLPNVEQEQSMEGLERHAAKPIYAICEASVPKIAIYTGKCYGPARLVMGTKESGIDTAFAWPSAELIDPQALSGFISGHNSQKSKGSITEGLIEKFAEPYWSAGLLLVDDIIDPRQTRPVLIETLGRLANKQEPVRPWRKYGLIPF